MSGAETSGPTVQDQDRPRCSPAHRARRLAHLLLGIPTPIIFAGSVGVAVLLLWWQGSLDQVGPVARSADRTTIAGAFLLYVGGLALACLRWQRLIRITRGTADLAPAAEAFLTSVVINYATPVSLAVPTRAALTKRAFGLNASETAAVAVWEIGCDVLVLGIASLIWLIATGAAAEATSLGGRLSAAELILVGVLVAGLAAGALIAVCHWPHHGRRLGRAAGELLRYPRRAPAAAGACLAITVVYWLVQALVLRLLLVATGAGSSPSLVLGLVSLPILIGMLSPVPGGAGVREALMLAVARIHGANGAAVLLAALTYRVALFAAVPLLYGLVRLWLARQPRHV